MNLYQSTRRIILLCIVVSLQNFSYAEVNSFPGDYDSAIPVDSINTTELSHVYNTDSTLEFKPVQIIIPGTLIGIGVIGVYHNQFIKLKNELHGNLVNFRQSRYLHFDDYIQYLPALAYPVFGLIKIPFKNSLRERIAIEVTAYIVTASVVNFGKYIFKEQRPDSNSRNSFPSGHSAMVFTGAELMRLEYGLGIGLASYAVAATVAFLRLYNGRHWINDVLAGAGIGILAARIGYWMLPIYRKWFNWNRNVSKGFGTIAPSYSPYDKSLSLNLMYQF